MTLEEAVRDEHRKHKNRRSQPLSNAKMRELLDDADAAITAAQAARAQLRGRTTPGEAEREAALAAALATLGGVAKPLRRESGRLARDEQRNRRWGDEVRRMATGIQRERRKLWKMQHRNQGRQT